MPFFKLDEFDRSGFDYGRPKFMVFLWFFIQDILFRFSPIPLYGFRSRLLRLFGAKIGKGVKIRPKVRIHYPWRVEIGDYSQVGDEAWLYSIGPIKIGNNSIISQKSFLCTAGHDHNDPYFRTVVKPITVGNSVWIAADVYVAPGVTVGDNSVVGARSSVFKDIPPGVMSYGNPCKVIKSRKA